VISIAAMKMGKHVYCQKPLTHSIYEARRMAEVAQETKVATQVAIGNQASESTRLLCEWIWDGAIGPVREVHNWSSRPFWPQGHDRPDEAQPVPPGLDWDLWLGPAPDRPFHHIYLPFVWRGWLDFGTGALGDMGCYSFDTLFRVLKLAAPTSVETCLNREYTLVRGVTTPKVNKETYPRAAIIRYHFPARENMAPVTVNWYDGGMLPARPEELQEQQELDKEGMLFVGDHGKILCEFNGSNPRLIPEAKMKAYKQPPKTLPRSTGHNQEWIDACKGGKPAGANFEFEGQVTETLLLGNTAILADKQKIRWDGMKLQSPDLPDSDKYINPPYRQGWTL
jgi:predicted dehydrogenase